ncbi:MULTISPECIES: hypothetical protein [Actinomadura]|uniref:Secreted protein n=1 Tax=Actinomadura litoris TaxID=2678616 RepID=A0A7K1L0S5_9ACTN|nr:MULTISPECIES: hypothetical protein [Actinomadura]MBT2206862.1 hypothetical protein [Actinomadura sp. NEAU-AAG7]MUN38038.1 hypothetical protein [Actinomadura litoris]
MRMRIAVGLLTSAALALTTAAATGTAAQAKERPCGRPVMAAGTGSQGTPWTLKSQYDDDGTPPNQLVAGEEFEIATTAAGQRWSVSFTDNGTEFFRNDNDISTATGIREVHPNPVARGVSNHMAAHAVRLDAAGNVIEVIDGAVDLAPPPARCGR